MSNIDPFTPGTLWDAVVERTRTALTLGALQPIETEVNAIEDGGVRFQVRAVSSLMRRRLDAARARSAGGKPVNPFLPYEENLFVADVSASHLCLLNKYNVIDHHTLIVTRDFESQESPLNLRDFEALWRCMLEYPALGFYNGGAGAGASQPHKHLQLVPLPLADSASLPIEPILSSPPTDDRPIVLPGIPYTHMYAALDPTRIQTGDAAARYILGLYRTMLGQTGMAEGPDLPSLLPPYNLLITRTFMLLFPRSRPSFESVPVNALGFAGSFFVPDPEGFTAIRRIGPMELLRQVT